MHSFFGLLGIFDWITPSIGFVEDLINDPTLLGNNTWSFFFSYHELLEHGWDAHSVENLLTERGIRTWGSQISLNQYFFNVSREQAKWAEHILSVNQIPIHPRSMGAPPAKRKRSDRPKQVKQAPRSNHGFFDEVDQFIDDLFGF